MTVYTLPEVKKELRKIEKEGGIKKVSIDIQEFGEGFDVHVNVYYYDKYNNSEFEFWAMSEEEPEKKALARAKRITESLSGRGFTVENAGIANC